MRIERWHALLIWLMPMVVATITFGTIYVVATQLDRLSANDAPARLASQVAAELREGQSATINAQPHVDLERSLAPFVVIENEQGVATAGSGFIRNRLVSLPTGMLSSAAQTGLDDVTWQPEPGLRFATVTLKVGDQFVSAGQSLAPSDGRLGTFQLLIGFGWLLAILVIGGCWFWLRRVRLALMRESQQAAAFRHARPQDSDAQSPTPHSSE